MMENGKDVFKRPRAITLVAVINLVWGVVIVLCSLLVLILDVGRVSFFDELAAPLYLLTLGIGILHLVCGFGLLNLKGWARYIQLGYTWIGLILLPLGTILAIPILSYLYKPGIRFLFGTNPNPTTDPEKLRVIRELAESDDTIATAAVITVPLVIFGIIAAIAVPNFMSAVDRSRIRQTMTDMRSLGTAWEAYSVDHGTVCIPGATRGKRTWGNVPAEIVKKAFCPDYIRVFPSRDAWGRSFQFYVDCQDEKKASYGIRSAGKDGIWSNTDDPAAKKTRRDYDIVYSDGQFIIGQDNGYCAP